MKYDYLYSKLANFQFRSLEFISGCLYMVRGFQAKTRVQRKNTALFYIFSFDLVHLVTCFVVISLTLAFLLTWCLSILSKTFFEERSELMNTGPTRKRQITQKHDKYPTKLHLVLQFPVILKINSNRLIIWRQSEYVSTLRNNLLHQHVEKVHLLLERSEDRDFIETLELQRRDKIVFYYLNRRMLYADAFWYVSTFLTNKTSMIVNADCFLGQGFQILGSKLPTRDTIYALTRHESQSTVKYCGGKDLCSQFSKYIASHDAFVMRLATPLSGIILKKLMVRPDIIGVEKLVIFVLRILGGFIVKNPCHILYLFHNHCSKLRNNEMRLINGERINRIYLSDVPHWKKTAPFSAL